MRGVKKSLWWPPADAAAAPDQDQSTGTNRAGVKRGQVPAASLVPPGPENRGGESIGPGGDFHFGFSSA